MSPIKEEPEGFEDRDRSIPILSVLIEGGDDKAPAF
jgi:hypothetical protein